MVHALRDFENFAMRDVNNVNSDGSIGRMVARTTTDGTAGETAEETMFAKLSYHIRHAYARLLYWTTGQARRIEKMEQSRRTIVECGENLRDCRLRMKAGKG